VKKGITNVLTNVIENKYKKVVSIVVSFFIDFKKYTLDLFNNLYIKELINIY